MGIKINDRILTPVEIALLSSSLFCSFSISNSDNVGRIDTDIAELKEEKKKVLIISLGQDKDSINLSQELRKKNVSCMVLYGKPGKALEYANAKDFPYVIFIGDEEVKKKKVKLKDMVTGKEKLVDWNKVGKAMS